MTAQELIAKLSEYPPDIRVLVDGYEDGLDDPCFRGDVKVWDLMDARYWEGKYSIRSPYADRPPDFVAIVLHR
jgi:hypothetical protein